MDQLVTIQALRQLAFITKDDLAYVIQIHLLENFLMPPQPFIKLATFLHLG
jgi:hypothetical protein